MGSAKAYYFLSIDPLNPNAETGPSARTGNQVLNDFMVSGKFWRQVAGLYTETVLDDKYEAVPWSGAPIHGGTPESWGLFFYSLTFSFVFLTSCVCCCYARVLLRARAQARDSDGLVNVLVNSPQSQL